MVRSAVAASLVGVAAASYQCPGGPQVTHAGLRMTSIAEANCDTVKAEMRARVAGENGWYDQHNRGTYTEQNYGGDISFSRLTGNGKYTDKMIFVLTDEGNSCKIEGCSESQVFSIFDSSANYCEQKLLYCGSDEGCNVANSDFANTEEELKTMAGASTNFGDCLAVLNDLDNIATADTTGSNTASLESSEMVEMESRSQCSGTKYPVPACYQGESGYGTLAPTSGEKILIKLEEVNDVGVGHLAISGKISDNGAIYGTPFECDSVPFIVSDGKILYDLDYCRDTQVLGFNIKKLNYCADQDTIRVSLNNALFPIPIPLPQTITLEKVACPAAVVV